MFANLNTVIATRAVDQVLVIDIDSHMMDMQPTTALAGTTAVDIAAIILSLGRIEPCEEDQITRLQLRRIGKQTSHFLAFLRHSNR